MVNENEVITIKLDDIIPNRFQPREMFDEESMQELADSIKTHDVIQPIIVRPVDNKYEIIAGERRYKASVMAGKTDIPALVKNKDDKDSSIIAFIENSQRKDVSAIEEARTCERILSTNDITQEQLAKQLGMSQSTLANKLRLLTLPVEVQESLLHGEISERHARSLISIKDTKKQLELLEKIKNEKLRVRELDGVIKSMLEEPNKDGLFNLPGSDEYKENLENTVPLDFSKYENKSGPVETSKEELDQFLSALDAPTAVPAVTPPVELPVAEETPAGDKSSEFTSFLTSIDDNKTAPTEATTPTAENPDVTEELKLDIPIVEEPKVEAPQEPATNEFLSFLNTIDDSKITPPADETPSDDGTEGGTTMVNTPVVEEPKVEAPKEESPNEFLSFLNTIDDNKIVPTESASTVETPATPEVKVEVPVVEEPKVETPAPTVEDKSFDDFLSNFNAGVTPAAPQEAQQAPATPEVKVEKPVVEEPKTEAPNDFMSFLNTFDDSKITKEAPKIEPVQEEVKTEVAKDSSVLAATAAIDDFLKKYEAPAETPVDLGPVEELKQEQPVAVEEKAPEVPADPNSKYLNPIEDVVEKPKYVENEPNYVDITKPISYDSVDSIIGELKKVTDKVKKSKYKITTEETNYDDVYTITIKIDKRNFL